MLAAPNFRNHGSSSLTAVWSVLSVLLAAVAVAACGRSQLDEPSVSDSDASDEVCEPGSTNCAFEPTSNPTYLQPGQHRFSRVRIPAGVAVYVSGAGDRAGQLELFATGPIIVDGTIDVSGGPGTPGSSSAGGNQAIGFAGGGGFTGEPFHSGAASAECAYVAGNPGVYGTNTGSSGSCPVIGSNACEGVHSRRLLFTAPVAAGGGAGVHTGFRAYGSAGGGVAGGAPGALCAPYVSASVGAERDCSGVSGAGGAVAGNGGYAGIPIYDGSAGTLGQTPCSAFYTDISPACVGGGGGGSIGNEAVLDLGVFSTFRTGSGGGGGSADFLERPSRSGTSGGGGGGGALRLVSNEAITINGYLLANGGAGGDAFTGTGFESTCDPQPGAAGGGGSGGLIYLVAPSLIVSEDAVISAVGGRGGQASPFATGGAGGPGGLGRIRLSVAPTACRLAGYFNPPLSAGCNVTNQLGATYIGVFPN